MLKSLTVAVLGFTILAACDNKVDPISVNKVITEKAKPIVPEIPTFKSKPVQWVVITQENVTTEFTKLSENGNRPVFVAVSETGYKAVIQNLSDLQAIVDKQKVVIATYEKSYN